MTVLIVGLLVVGFLLLVAEVFVPGGIVGAIGGVVLMVGVVLSFLELGTGRGTFILAATAFAVFVLLYLGLRILPHTRLGRKVFLSETLKGKAIGPAAEKERARLVGREGVALTDLRPAGRGLINGRRWDVVSDGGYIARDARFRVVKVEGMRIVVQSAEDG